MYKSPMISSDTAAVLYGIASAVTWGAADFNGGLASRKGELTKVVASAQLIGFIFLVFAAILSREALPPVRDLCCGALAGIIGILGLLALYRGMSLGRMGIVAPLSAVLSALVPVGYTMLFIGLPTVSQFTGFAFFTVAVWLLCSGDAKLKMTMQELLLSILAGGGFGLFFILLDLANDQAVFWPLVSARIASVLLMLTVIRFKGSKRVAEPAPGRSAGLWIFIVLCGVLDAGGNCLFSMAAQTGRLDIAAVLSSLYPAATVLLALIFLKEKLQPVQWMGVSFALVSLVLIAM